MFIFWNNQRLKSFIELKMDPLKAKKNFYFNILRGHAVKG